MFKTTETTQGKECLMAKKYEAKKTMKNRRCLICGHEIDSHDWTYNLKLRNRVCTCSLLEDYGKRWL